MNKCNDMVREQMEDLGFEHGFDGHEPTHPYSSAYMAGWLSGSEERDNPHQVQGCQCDKLPEFDMDGSPFVGCCTACRQAYEADMERYANGWIGTTK